MAKKMKNSARKAAAQQQEAATRFVGPPPRENSQIRSMLESKDSPFISVLTGAIFSS